MGGAGVSPVQIFQHLPHSSRQRLDLFETGPGFFVVALFVEQQQLSLGENGGQWVRQVVTQFPYSVLRRVHLEQRAVEIPQVVLAEITYGLPQVLVTRGAEDFGCAALELGIGGAKEHACAPNGIGRLPHGETNEDLLTVEPDGGEVVNDCFANVS